MKRWIVWVLLVVLNDAAERVWAAACTGHQEGEACVLSDGQTIGTCTGGACTRTFTVPAGEARTGTGTISSSGGVTVTGSGTVFTTEMQVGDVLIANSQSVAITTILSDSSLHTTPAFSPAISAGTVFTYMNPVTRWMDENGNTLAILDARGLLSLGLPYTGNILAVQGAAETASGAPGKAVSLVPGAGGPAGGTANGGPGGSIAMTSAPGGASSSATLSTGNGGSVFIRAGASPTNTGGGPNGTGGTVSIQGGAGATQGNIFLCDSNGSTVRTGVGGGMQVDCATGGFTKIGGVTVSAFPPTNAAGVLKNNGSGTYSLSAVAGTDFATQAANTHFAGPSSGSAAAPTFRAVVMADLPAAAQNAINAFVHANAGGI